jgi:hypothetical protein
VRRNDKGTEFLPSLFSDRQTVEFCFQFKADKALTGSDGQSLLDRFPNSMLHERLFARSSPAGIDSIELWDCSKARLA